jgi:hypothetical protein
MKHMPDMMHQSGTIADVRASYADVNVCLSEAKLKKKDLFDKRPTFD